MGRSLTSYQQYVVNGLWHKLLVIQLYSSTPLTIQYPHFSWHTVPVDSVETLWAERCEQIASGARPLELHFTGLFLLSCWLRDTLAGASPLKVEGKQHVEDYSHLKDLGPPPHELCERNKFKSYLNYCVLEFNLYNHYYIDFNT